MRSVAAASSRRLCGVIQSIAPGPSPTTATEPTDVRGLRAPGTSANEKYGTEPSSTAAAGSTRSADVLARST
jgi:hypothetical protein